MNVASEWTQQINKLENMRRNYPECSRERKTGKYGRKVKIPGKKKRPKSNKHTCHHGFQKIRVVLLEEIIRIF